MYTNAVVFLAKYVFLPFALAAFVFCAYNIATYRGDKKSADQKNREDNSGSWPDPSWKKEDFEAKAKAMERLEKKGRFSGQEENVDRGTVKITY